ncbi:MAG TPA: hypothetical protein ENJ65_03545 [Candidatus Tenderia electrophaga]|uniref:Outer membrane protein beta-barrel domain-containing protein n=1 Tax=Candidatus Tenderia electrophaga TaxID=1748243 RepID=A0A832J3J2_9GAMM|nr:hypothetical protein [Candidatus Tenderia electrophaga]
MKRVIAAALVLSASAVQADDLDLIGSLNQSQFKALSKDLTAAFSYKAGAPAESLGVLGFDAGLALSSTKLENTSAWTAAMSSGDSIETLVVPKLYLQKGLPFDIDIGAYYLSVPGTNLEAWGGEIKYAFISGNVALPAVAVRAAMTSLTAVDQLELKSRSFDVSISKSILFVTPYAGVGRVWADSKPLAAGAVASSVDISDTRTFVGVSVQPLFFNLALERDSVGGIASYNLKLGMAF